MTNQATNQLLFEILKELKIVRAHLEELTGKKFSVRTKD